MNYIKPVTSFNSGRYQIGEGDSGVRYSRYIYEDGRVGEWKRDDKVLVGNVECNNYVRQYLGEELGSFAPDIDNWPEFMYKGDVEMNAAIHILPKAMKKWADHFMKEFEGKVKGNIAPTGSKPLDLANPTESEEK